jgi:murein DD-endopeptidase MepM/ murein hydrolase activator NlpD
MKTFLLKAKQFFKRNIYPITVSLCTVLILGVVTVSAYSSIKGGSDVVVDTNSPSTDINNSTNVGDKKEEGKDVVSSETIIFELPFDKASIAKEYTDSTLLYDATTKLWCTHQGLDFACNDGQEARAVYDGKITKIENSMMNGTVVYLKVSDNLVVVYKGLASNISVKEGDTVKKGAIIGRISGLLAEKADGVHLHLELLKDNKLIDPTEYFSFSK